MRNFCKQERCDRADVPRSTTSPRRVHTEAGPGWCPRRRGAVGAGRGYFWQHPPATHTPPRPRGLTQPRPRAPSPPSDAPPPLSTLPSPPPPRLHPPTTPPAEPLPRGRAPSRARRLAFRGDDASRGDDAAAGSARRQLPVYAPYFNCVALISGSACGVARAAMRHWAAALAALGAVLAGCRPAVGINASYNFVSSSSIGEGDQGNMRWWMSPVLTWKDLGYRLHLYRKEASLTYVRETENVQAGTPTDVQCTEFPGLIDNGRCFLQSRCCTDL